MSELVPVVKAVRSRHAIVVWYGNCSYRRLKVTLEVRKMLCPFCNSELVDLDYSGSMALVTNRNAVGFVRDNWLPLLEGGVRVWHILPKRKRCWKIIEKAEESYD